MRACPECEHPTVSLWRLLSLGGLRRARCRNCGTLIGLSPLSSFALAAFGTWTPFVGAGLCSLAAAGISKDLAFAGAIVGGVVSSVAFAWLFFRLARLIAMERS